MSNVFCHHIHILISVYIHILLFLRRSGSSEIAHTINFNLEFVELFQIRSRIPVPDNSLSISVKIVYEGSISNMSTLLFNGTAMWNYCNSEKYQTNLPLLPNRNAPRCHVDLIIGADHALVFGISKNLWTCCILTE